MTQEHIKDETSAGNPKKSGDQSSPSPEEYQTAPSTVTEYFTVSSSNLNINDDPVKDAKLPTKVYISHSFILRPQKGHTVPALYLFSISTRTFVLTTTVIGSPRVATSILVFSKYTWYT